MMGVTSKPLAQVGAVAGNIQVGLDIAQNGLDYANGNIGGGRAMFRTGGVLAGAIASSVIGGEVGAMTGTAFGPGPGTAAGAVTGAAVSFGTSLGIGVMERSYDKISTGVVQGYNNFINTINHNIARYKIR